MAIKKRYLQNDGTQSLVSVPAIKLRYTDGTSVFHIVSHPG